MARSTTAGRAVKSAPREANGRSPSSRRTRASQAAAARRRRRMIAAGAAIVAAGVLATIILTRTDDSQPSSVPTAAPVVGGDLHTVAVVGGSLFVGGHEAVAVSRDAGQRWTPISSLANADAMGWAVTTDAVLVGGHPGLFKSTDNAATFTKANGSAAIEDVHGLGAAGDTVYAASPQSGLLVSTDGGATWTIRNQQAGRSFMGTLLVDPKDPQRVIAPDMQNGIVATDDGGRSWRSLGGPAGAMAIAWNPAHINDMIAVGMDGGAISRDGGATWAPVQMPPSISAVAYTADGATMYAAALQDGRAHTYASSDRGHTWHPTAGT